MTPTEAQDLIAGNENEVINDSLQLRELRQTFMADQLRDCVQTYWRSFKTPNQGMLPTLLPGDHFSIHKITSQRDEPKRGDIIAFRYPEDETKILVKRVVGLPPTLGTSQSRGTIVWSALIASCANLFFPFNTALNQLAIKQKGRRKELRYPTVILL